MIDVRGLGVADEAAEAILGRPEARRNGALPSLAAYLAFEAPTVDPLPFLFLRKESEIPSCLEKARHFAVGGRLLVARVRWLDEMVDSGRMTGTPEEIHRLSTAVHAEAVSRFCLGFRGAEGAAIFFATLADLEARYAASLVIDVGTISLPSSCRPAPVQLGSYAEQARARAMVASASVEALLISMDAGEDEKDSARRCLSSIAVAWQLGDDVLDLEEDYLEGRLSWIISQTLHGFPEDGVTPGPDEFYEVALLGGHLRRALEESLAFYHEAERIAAGLFPGVERFIKGETGKTEDMLADLNAIATSAQR